MQAITAIFSINYRQIRIEQLSILTSAIITLLALYGFFASYQSLKIMVSNQVLSLEMFYELLFWSGGHVLQFNFVQIMMLIWIYLSPNKLAKFKKLLPSIMVLNLILLVPVLPELIHPSVEEASFQLLFTNHMIYAAGIAPTILAILILFSIKDKEDLASIGPDYKKTVLLCSMLVFFIGGFIGTLIKGINVIIPAHYHGSIIGVTIAYMGIVYLLLPLFGMDNPKTRMVKWQNYCLAFGQILHITGLAWSGGYGVMRKTPGAVASAKAKIAMMVMGVGGLLAVIGGILFLFIVVPIILNKLKSEEGHE